MFCAAIVRRIESFEGIVLALFCLRPELEQAKPRHRSPACCDRGSNILTVGIFPGSGCIVRRTALRVTAIAVCESAYNVERAIQLVCPDVIAALPHGDGFGP